MDGPLYPQLDCDSTALGWMGLDCVRFPLMHSRTLLLILLFLILVARNRIPFFCFCLKTAGLRLFIYFFAQLSKGNSLSSPFPPQINLNKGDLVSCFNSGIFIVIIIILSLRRRQENWAIQILEREEIYFWVRLISNHSGRFLSRWNGKMDWWIAIRILDDVNYGNGKIPSPEWMYFTT